MRTREGRLHVAQAWHLAQLQSSTVKDEEIGVVIGVGEQQAATRCPAPGGEELAPWHWVQVLGEQEARPGGHTHTCWPHGDVAPLVRPVARSLPRYEADS